MSPFIRGMSFCFYKGENMKYEDKVIVLLLILFFTSVVCNVVFIKREMTYMLEIEKFFSGCKAVSRDKIECHVPVEWNVIGEKK